MSEAVPPPPGPDATPEELEADISQTRARLAGNVDALAGKLDVKSQAQDKVADVKSQAQAKVADVRAQAQAKVSEVRATVQEKAAVAKAAATDRLSSFSSSSSSVPAGDVGVASSATALPGQPVGRHGTAPPPTLVDRFLALPRPALVAAAAAPVLVVVALVARRARS